MLPGWTTTTLAGHRIDFHSPSPSPRGMLLFLHPFGGEMPSTNEAFTKVFESAGLAVAAPFGGTSWWSDRLCPDFSDSITAERFLVDQVVPWMHARWPRTHRTIAVAGISMGGQGAVRLGLKYPDRFPIVASIAGAFDYHEWHGQGTTIESMYRSREACRQDTAILQIHPSKFPPHIWLACDPNDDEWIRGNDRLHEKLKAMGIAHTTDFGSSHGGHDWPYFNAMAEPMTRFCVAAIEKELRRLI